MQAKTVKTTETYQEDVPTLAAERKTRSYAAIDQFVYLIFGIIQILLLARFAFRLTAANPGAGIVAAVYALTEPLMIPFRIVFPTQQAAGAVFEWSILVAMFFYALLAWIIMRLIRIIYTAEA
jgi:uncharacterized membrane protein